MRHTTLVHVCAKSLTTTLTEATRRMPTRLTCTSTPNGAALISIGANADCQTAIFFSSCDTRLLQICSPSHRPGFQLPFFPRCGYQHWCRQCVHRISSALDLPASVCPEVRSRREVGSCSIVVTRRVTKMTFVSFSSP